MADALFWWVAAQGIALAALPITVIAFRALPDRGYAFAKILGPLLFTLLVWAVGVTQIVVVSRGVVWVLFYAFVLVNLLLVRRVRGDLRRLWRDNRPAIIATELLFAGVYAFWCFGRALSPEIDSTEKPMDFAMLNAALRATSYPPEDPWLAGHPVAYYYLGYLTAALLTKLTGIASAVTFNLMGALLAAQAATGVFAVTANLAAAAFPRPEGLRHTVRLPHVLTGALAAFLLLFVGNLEGALELARAWGFGSPEFYQWVGVKGLTPLPSARWYPDDLWFWWRSTRVIDTVVDGQSRDYTITEYPFFSFLLGDLHPHVMALPLTLLALGVALAIVLGPTRPRVSRKAPLLVIGPAVALGTLGFTNIWDLPSYVIIVLAAGALRVALAPSLTAKAVSLTKQPPARDFRWPALAQWGVAVIIATVGLFVPFYFGTLASSVGGISSGGQGGLVRFWTGPASRPLHTVLFWGPLLLGAGIALWALTGQLTERVRLWGRAGLVFPVVLWLMLEVQAYRLAPPPDALSVVWTPRLWPVLPLLAASAVLVATVRSSHKAGSVTAARRSRAVAAGVLVLGAGLSLIAVCEWVFLRDVFNNRMNTVFKLYYEAWTLLAVGSAFGVGYAFAAGLLPGAARWLAVGKFGAAVLMCAAVIPAALANRSDGFRRPLTLDGLAHVAAASPGELAAANWLRSQPNVRAILEAPGPQYSRHAQLSARTGIPTLLGWPGHESQWRGNQPVLGERERDADAIYQATDKRSVVDLLHRHNVGYVAVGPAERSKYPPGVLQAFEGVFPVAFREGDVTLYRVP